MAYKTRETELGEKPLGKGTFGNVYQVLHCGNALPFAVKLIQPPVVNTKHAEHVAREVFHLKL